MTKKVVARVERAIAMVTKRSKVWKRAMTRVARAMGTVKKVAVDEEGDGNMMRVEGNCEPKIECMML